jgi:hypothetical protein
VSDLTNYLTARRRAAMMQGSPFGAPQLAAGSSPHYLGPPLTFHRPPGYIGPPIRTGLTPQVGYGIGPSLSAPLAQLAPVVDAIHSWPGNVVPIGTRDGYPRLGPPARLY